MNAKTLIVAFALAATAVAAVPSASAWAIYCAGTSRVVCDAVNEANGAVQELRQCGEPGLHVCIQQNTPEGTCILATFGLQGAIACVDDDPLDVTVCSTLFITGVGNCPTDLI